MIDRADTDQVIYRVSVAAFAFYPDKAEQEAGYTVEEDVDWAVEPLLTLDASTIINLRVRVREAIVDAGMIDRQAFIRYVKGLAIEG